MFRPKLYSILLAVCLGIAPRGAFAESRSGSLTDLAERMAGRFQSAAMYSEVGGPQLIDTRVRVENPQLGEHVIYWQIDIGPERQTYRQRLLVLKLDPETGLIRQRTWSFHEPNHVLDQFERLDAFSTLTVDDLFSELPEDCDPLWQAKDNVWRGYTDPERCRIFSQRHQDWRYIEAEVELDEQGLRSTERGFDGSGTQLFGTEPGVFIELKRMPADH